MRNLLTMMAAAAVLGAGAAEAQVAVPLTYGAGYTTFYFYAYNGDYSLQADPYQDDAVFTFDIVGAPERLSIADGYNAGDQFEININGGADIDTSVPLTPNPNVYNPNYYIDGNYAAAFYPTYSSAFSHYTTVLPAGSYSITGSVIAFSPIQYGFFGGSGSGGIELGAVPEPVTWALMLLGVGGIGGAMRRRRGTVALAN